MKKRKDGLYRKSITVDGKRFYFYGKSEREINKKIAEFNTKKSHRPFRDVAQQWEKKHREEIGIKCWMNYKPHYEDIVALHGAKDITEISAMDVQADMQKAKTDGYSATIIRTRRSIYRMILNFAFLQGWIPYNPALPVGMPKGIKRATPREAPEDDVLQIVLNNVDKPFGLYPLFLLCTGMRKAEVLSLTWDDIKDDYITVTKALDYAVHAHPVVKPPKSEAGIRIVPLNEPLKSVLHARKPKDTGKLIFPPDMLPPSRRKGTSPYITNQQYETAWKKYCKSVGLVDAEGKHTVTAHQFRHGFATIGFEADVDEKTMQTILGHASPDITRQIYQHLRNKKRALSESKMNEQFKKLTSEKG